MSDFDFMSVPKIVLIIGVLTLYVTVTVAIFKSLIFKRKTCTPYHTDFVFTENYKGIEKRRESRIMVELNASLISDALSYTGPIIIEDLSIHGFKCKAENLPIMMHPGEKVIIDIPSQKELGHCQVHARLVWKQEQDKHFILGAEFLQKNNILENYVKHLKKHIT